MEVVLAFTEKIEDLASKFGSACSSGNILSQKLGSWWLWACACVQDHPALSTSGLVVTSERTDVLLKWVSGLP